MTNLRSRSVDIRHHTYSIWHSEGIYIRALEDFFVVKINHTFTTSKNCCRPQGLASTEYLRLGCLTISPVVWPLFLTIWPTSQVKYSSREWILMLYFRFFGKKWWGFEFRGNFECFTHFGIFGPSIGVRALNAGRWIFLEGLFCAIWNSMNLWFKCRYAS